MTSALLIVLITLCTQVAMAEEHTQSDPGIEIREAWIPMPDGVRLAADLYLPVDAEENRNLPVLLEYTPYRKMESRGRNYPLYSYFVKHGYVVARVDIRGTGNSEGHTIPYEYSDIELDDGEVVIEWLSKQPWSSGRVGMFGISWGGFNAIQMAMRNPPALKAFIALMATEELYQEDVHYIDGIMHTDSWMMSHDLYNALPAAPEFKIDDEWVRLRFEKEPSVYSYMRRQRDGPFWDRASARDKYHRIKIPGFHIGGWYDGYRNSLPRMLENVEAPVKALIGPWDHYFPHNAWPTPQIEWRREAVRWWDYWLKDTDTGIMDEPAFAFYMRNWHPPDPALESVPGYWRWGDGWPLKAAVEKLLFLSGDHGLGDLQEALTDHSLKYTPSVGLEGGGPVMWWGNIAPDQQAMDDHCLVYDSPPLEDPLEIIGFPRVMLKVTPESRRANWFVRISDVSPAGEVTLVSGAGFNGTHRISPRQPSDLVPGETIELGIELQFTSWVFEPGHRVRLAVSHSQWPMFWPTPELMKSTLHLGGDGGSRLTLPLAPAASRPGPQFRKPAPDPGLIGFETLDAGNVSGYGEIREVLRDPKTGEAFGVATNTGAERFPWGISRFEERIEHRTSDKDPAHSSVRGIYAVTQELKDRELRFEQEVTFSSDDKAFRLVFVRRVRVNGAVRHEKRWDEIIPRDFQ